MSDNQGVELLPVIQADRDAAAMLYEWFPSLSGGLVETALKTAQRIRGGSEDNRQTVQSFARHRLSITPASAGVLVEAQALVKRLRYPGSGALWGPPITEEAADIIEALSATATPASDGVTVSADLPTDNYGMTVLDRMRDTAENGTMPPEYRKDLFALLDLATTPTPDRFGEGYQVGVEASAKVAEAGAAYVRCAGIAAGNEEKGNSTGRMIDGLVRDIRALQPDAGEGA